MRIQASFAHLWRNDDKGKYALAQATLAGQHRFIEHTRPELEPQAGVPAPSLAPAVKAKTRKPGQAA